ncbi:hypothetical protein BDZ94DRAFT_1325446 [Collybia nuda]|uniref:Uncharacterized protein n=1 Tax=Collybia nuda TaxID=64659 RepID=A0A9P5XVI7_9AGAR|nr:hypothetical protein BDZ94DRAFT_1325446 [Collybia nuda]
MSSPPSYTSITGCPKCQTHHDMDALPDHWRPPATEKRGFTARVHLFFFRILCLLSIGHRSLRHTYPHITCGQQLWDESRALLQNRVENTTVVCGLLLATTAVFLTTLPPSQPTLDYLVVGPYICILLSFGLALGGLIMGSAIIFVTSTCNVEWFINKWTRSRSRLYCILFLVSYPHISVAISGSLCAIGIALAASFSENRLISIGSVFVVLFPTATVSLFAWITIM